MFEILIFKIYHFKNIFLCFPLLFMNLEMFLIFENLLFLNIVGLLI